MFVLNTEIFGFIMRPELLHTAEEYANYFLNFKLKTLGEGLLWRQLLGLLNEWHMKSIHSRVCVCVCVECGV